MPEPLSLQFEKFEAVARHASTPTARRNAKLVALLAELAVRDMNHEAVAGLLACSMATARIYMNDLLDAALVSSLPLEQGQACANRASYRMVADQRTIDAFVDEQLARETDLPPRGQARHVNRAGLHIHTLFGDVRSLAPGHGKVQRDPLVAALFGDASPLC